MNFESLQTIPEARFLSEQRKSTRNRDLHLLAITNRGTGQIIDISQDGLSFGCLYPHHFPEEFTLDLLDAKGTHIKYLQVRKVWERRETAIMQNQYELEVGVEFAKITSDQHGDLTDLLHYTDDILVHSVI